MSAAGRRRVAIAIAIVAAVAGLLAVSSVLVGSSARSDQDPPHAAAGSDPGPLDLATVSPQVADHYRFAFAHADELSQMRCWCGCEQFLDHRNLADCFERRDGRGPEAHAAGCGVCLGEAGVVRRMLGEGRSVTDIAAALDTQFGPTVTTAPATQ